ncbi:hypothetical protein EUX98_g5072 [Antrodiella citrinella]|uniref:Uncharacterized protein n=1 Tax=Antrodiella citrinella TaxID=2447956 RepID=A0A4S4MUW6_9APHY|nr:hypothetical protein EUX98_g5072 [Antrodiella citrinella]
METPKSVMTTSKQPQAVQMSAVNPPARTQCQHTEEPKKGLAARLRGGGAGKVRYDYPYGVMLPTDDRPTYRTASLVHWSASFASSAARAEKENRSSHFTHVAWSERNEIHTLSATLGRGKPLKSSGLRQQPGRSILKKVQVPLPSMDECQRETTPEPSDPLVDLTYLESSVKAIIATEIVLKDLVEAYNTLTLRIRACVAGNTDADASWPLFQPIRKNREAFVDALVRDLGRALEKPLSQTVEPESDEECKMIEDVEEPCEDAFKGLPSPKESPKKKRKGMSAEQVKHARDLCTTCHATLKFLSAVFTIPAVYRLFKEKQLRFVLTHVLAIPLAEALPTPNARKTYALAIFLIQTQRLPDEVLEPAANRIAYAIRRGIEGELGKEGKKGSINDGLKAVHDLATTYPAIFVPAFTELLPSVFACLLGPTYAIRTQSCSALGGFAIASASIPLSPVHTRISAYTALYLTDVPPGTPSKKGSPMDDSAIVRTLRMLLKTSDPVVAAQGPVWALCLMASFVVMLRKAVYSNAKVTPIFVALFNVGLHHPKSSVRGLVTAVWRTMTWAYFTPPLMKLPSSDDEVEEEEDAEEDVDTQEAETRYGKLWKVLSGVTEMGNGVSSVGALLSTETEDNLRRAVYVMKRMGRNGGAACKDAMDLVCQLVSQGAENEWEPMKLLPNALFSTNPGLLTAEYNELAQAVRPILARFPGVEDVRALTDEELSQPWVFMGLLNVWMEGLRNLRLFWGCKELPEEIHEVWLRLLQVNVKTLTEAENDAELRRLADGVVTVLCDILDEEDLDLSSGVDDTNSNVLPTIPIELQASPGSWRKLALKSFVVEQLWIVVRDTVPRDVLAEPTEMFLAYLIQHEPHLVPDVLQADQAHASWAQLCATVALTCETAEVEAFFGGRRCSADKKKSWEWVPAVRSQVWSQFIKVWDDRQVNWESGVLLLAVPFSSSSSWELDNEDLNSWDGYLRYTMDKALDYGVDS